MADSKRKIQIVFLIDSFRDSEDNESYDKSKYLNLICLSVFRTLLYFTELIAKSDHSRSKSLKRDLKWGFKFFNSRVHDHKLVKYIFRDFKLKYFEEFEYDIEKKFDEPIPNLKKQCGSDCLKKALMEVVHDFQWDSPEFFSPVKRSSRHKSATGGSSIQRNYVFLFTKCPGSEMQMKAFAGKKVMDAEIFLDSFMPPGLLQEFYETKRLNLFWIHSPYPSSQNMEEERIDNHLQELIDQSLSKLGGKLIMLDLLIQKSIDKNRNIYQLFESFVKKEFQSTLLNSSTSSHNSKDEKVNHTASRVISFSKVLESATNFSRKNQACTFSNIGTSIVSINGDLICKIKVCITSSDMKKTETFLTHFQDALSSNPLVVQGVVEFQKGTQFHCENYEYMCVPFDGSSTEQEHFQGLLGQLVIDRLSMVLFVDGMSTLVLLKPLTIASASLSVICTDSLLDVEKLILSKAEAVLSPTKVKKSSQKALKDLIGKAVKSRIQEVKTNSISISKGSTKPDSYGSSTNFQCYDANTLERSFLPGCGNSFNSLVAKLNERIGQLDFLTAEETVVLKNLQKMYRQEKMPKRDYKKTKEEKTLNTEMKAVSTSPVDEMNTSLVRRDKKGQLPTRGEMMVTRSRLSICGKDKPDQDIEDRATLSSRQSLTNTEILNCTSDFKNEEELKSHIKEIYSITIADSEKCMHVCVQSIVLVVKHFFKEKNAEDVEEKYIELLQPDVMLLPSALREKYQIKPQEEFKQQKIREYQIQVILRLEIQSNRQKGDESLSENCPLIDEMVTLLRTLSFMAEASTLSMFMREHLVQFYLHSLPHMLGTIYDELMQPMPEVLESILSPDQSANTSLLDESTAGNETSGPASNLSEALPQPPSNKTLDSLRSKKGGRKLVHHPSLADVGAKRQIMVPLNKAKEEKKTKTGKKSKSSKSMGKDAEKVVRSLFEGRGKKLERRQSVAVMENMNIRSHHRNRKPQQISKSPSAAKMSFKSPTASLKRKVMETPAHKQKANRILAKIERRRERSLSSLPSTVCVVEESPVKSLKSELTSPVQRKRAMALVRRSFYSAGPEKRSRNLTKSLQSTERIPIGRNNSRQSLSQTIDISAQFMSPEKDSSFMFSQLLGSPTPPKGTPRKNDRTPMKSPFNSPSSNTRSQSLRLTKTPKRSCLVPDSPSCNTRSKLVNDGTPRKWSPSEHVLLSPVRQSPRFSSIGKPKMLFAESPLSKKPLNEPIERKEIASKVTSDINPHHVDGSKSPLQKTNAMTPKSSKAKMFLFRSPDNSSRKVSPKTTVSRSKCKKLLLTNSTDEPSQLTIESQQKLSNTPNGTDSLSKETSPLANSQPTAKTPSSLDDWPRKKRGSLVRSLASKFKSHDDTGSDSVVSIAHPEDDTNEMTSPRRRVKRKIMKLDAHSSTNEDIFSDLSQEGTSTPEEPTVECTSMSKKKRSFTMSPESVASPNKRACRVGVSSVASPVKSLFSSLSSPQKHKRMHSAFGQKELPISALHSRILSRTFSVTTSNSQGSQGFETENLSHSSVISESGANSSSQLSEEYFSLSNDEVFLSSQNVSQILHSDRPDSPILGSAKKKRRLDNNNEDCANVENIYSPSEHVLARPSLVPRDAQMLEQIDCKNDASSSGVSVSPSSTVSTRSRLTSPASMKKYSPSVSAKSLMHLINSPLITSPSSESENKSPSIMRDLSSRQRPRGRSKRSLNMCN